METGGGGKNRCNSGINKGRSKKKLASSPSIQPQERKEHSSTCKKKLAPINEVGKKNEPANSTKQRGRGGAVKRLYSSADKKVATDSKRRKSRSISIFKRRGVLYSMKGKVKRETSRESVLGGERRKTLPQPEKDTNSSASGEESWRKGGWNGFLAAPNEKKVSHRARRKRKGRAHKKDVNESWGRERGEIGAASGEGKEAIASWLREKKKEHDMVSTWEEKKGGRIVDRICGVGKRNPP